jgi:putative transposase
MDHEESERHRQEIADFRHSVVAELCNPYLTDDEKKSLIRGKTERHYVIPHSKKTTLSAETIRSWATKYSLYGKEGLLPKQREDRGRPRSFTDEEANLIIEELEKHPKWTAVAAVKKLQKEGRIKTDIKTSSLSRFLQANNLRREQRVKASQEKDQKRFAFEGPLECVQADAMHGFHIPNGKGRKQKAILLAFIDDATRRILYAQFAFSEKSILFEQGIKHILQAHGNIGRLYCDNGSTFVSGQTKRILETLKIYLVHSKPYRPQGRGKIERFFRTVRQSFLNMLDEGNIQGLQQLNMLFSTWLETEYHREVHSSLGVTPLDAWLSKCHTVRKVDPLLDLDFIFLHHTTRRVYEDSIVSLGGIAFEVPSILIGKRVSIFYDPHHEPVTRILVRHEGKDYGEAGPVDLYANTKVKRNKDIGCELEIIPSENNSVARGASLI